MTIDLRALPAQPLGYVYCLLAIICAINVVWLAVSRVDLAWTGMIPDLATTSVFVLLLYMSKAAATARPQSVVMVRMHRLFVGLVFLKLAWVNLRIFNHLSMSLGLPYADIMLAGWDDALGLDWLWYFNTLHDIPDILRILALSYTSLTPLSVVVFVGLVALGHLVRASFFLETFFFTAVAAMAIGALFPAEAAVATKIADITLYPNFSGMPGSYHLVHFDNLRSRAGPIILHPQILPGLVTFPSFHTAAGIILCAAVFRTWMMLPATLYSVVMIASTPIYGAHYIVDLLAGAMLATAVATALSRTERYRGIWQPNCRDTTTGLAATEP